MNPMGGLDPAMMSRIQQLIQQNPQLAMLLQKPGLMQKLQSIAQNPNDPTIAQQYASDPDVQQLMQIIGPAMGMGNNNQPSPFMNVPPHQQNQYSNLKLVTFIQSETQFVDIITKAPKDKLVVCDFFAVWCGPCKKIAPEFERFAKLYKNAIFIKVDVDKNRSLAQRKKISAMPTFQLYKNKLKIDEMRGADARKLEDLITKHVTMPNSSNSAPSQKQSPYSMFPLHEQNRPIYTKAPFKKMKNKLKQLNQKFISDEKEAVKFALNETEWNLLTQIVSMLQDRAGYANQKFSSEHYKLLDKLLSWPLTTLPPVLDLIRVLSLHPSFVEYCSKNFNTNNKFVLSVMKIGGNGKVNAVNGMLTCRIIINLFNRRITAKVFEHNYSLIIDHLLPNMSVREKKNTRLAFVRVLLHFAYCFYKSGNSNAFYADKVRCLALCSELLNRESESDIILNILMGIGTLLFRDANVIQFANSLEMRMIFQSYRQKYDKQNQQIVDCCSELIQAMEKPNL